MLLALAGYAELCICQNTSVSLENCTIWSIPSQFRSLGQITADSVTLCAMVQQHCVLGFSGALRFGVIHLQAEILYLAK
jgi:hypothetical protein